MQLDKLSRLGLVLGGPLGGRLRQAFLDDAGLDYTRVLALFCQVRVNAPRLPPNISRRRQLSACD